jgi:hypothetical protein
MRRTGDLIARITAFENLLAAARRAARGKRDRASVARFEFHLEQISPLVCSRCGGPVRIVAFVIAAAPIQQILQHIGEPLEPPVLRPARGPPDEFFADQTICLDEQVNQDR